MEFDVAVDRLTARGRGRMVPDLDRITALADLLGDPQLAYPTVHVTGTNGKSSVARMVTSLCAAVGLKAGTYTSPHLQSVRERLSVAGRMISEQGFADLYADVEPLADLVDEQTADPDHVTYFELLTAMAYWWFAQAPVDVGIFEVGMGGRWDATNLVAGDVAVLTPIDLDHAELGGTVEEVAEEKLGIIKPDSRVVTADQPFDVLERIRAVVAERSGDLLVAGEDAEILERIPGPGGQELTVRIGEREVDRLVVPLLGPHQAENALLALSALAQLAGPSFDDVDDDLLRRGLLATSAPGRLEIVSREPTVVLDGAHNPHGARSAAVGVEEAFDFASTFVVVACLADKDVAGILEAWRDLTDHVVVTRPDSPRGQTTGRMRTAASDVWEGTGVAVETAPDVATAVEKARSLAAPGDGVVVTGSLYTVGAARDLYLPVTDAGDEVIYEPEDIDDEADERRFNEALDAMIARLDEDRAPRG